MFEAAGGSQMFLPCALGSTAGLGTLQFGSCHCLRKRDRGENVFFENEGYGPLSVCLSVQIRFGEMGNCLAACWRLSFNCFPLVQKQRLCSVWKGEEGQADKGLFPGGEGA